MTGEEANDARPKDGNVLIRVDVGLADGVNGPSEWFHDCGGPEVRNMGAIRRGNRHVLPKCSISMNSDDGLPTGQQRVDHDIVADLKAIHIWEPLYHFTCKLVPHDEGDFAEHILTEVAGQIRSTETDVGNFEQDLTELSARNFSVRTSS